MVVAMVTPACFPTKKQEMTLNIFHIEMHYYTQVNTKLLREKKIKTYMTLCGKSDCPVNPITGWAILKRVIAVVAANWH